MYVTIEDKCKEDIEPFTKAIARIKGVITLESKSNTKPAYAKYFHSFEFYDDSRDAMYLSIYNRTYTRSILQAIESYDYCQDSIFT